MRVYIITSDEPVFITPFLSKVVRALPSEVVGIAVVEGAGPRAMNQRQATYLLALILAMGPFAMARIALTTACFRMLDTIPAFRARNPLSIRRVARSRNVPVIDVHDVNAPEFIQHLDALSPDIVINQADVILGKDILAVPRIACLNRHGALLPKYRGRLAPFWAYTHMERVTGVTVHFVERKLDSGPIVVQKKIRIERFDTLGTLLRKIFSVAPEAMLEAIDLLRSGDYADKLRSNDDRLASYYSDPTIRDAIRYLRTMIARMLLGHKAYVS